MREPLLNPRSVVVVGASRHRTKLGTVIAKNILDGGFRGRVELVNPTGGRVLGRTLHRSVAALSRAVDLAVIAVPAVAVTEVVLEIGRRGIRAAIVIAAGFAESGPVGERRQTELASMAKRTRVSLLGPNCLGVVNPWTRLNASFAGRMPETGSVAVVSQSGAMAVAIADWARANRLGISTMVSLGNEADRDAAWALSALARDGHTKSVLLYLENLRDARAFVTAGRTVAGRVSKVAVLAGATAAGAAAAVSHTGRLATPMALTRAALRDAGVAVVDSLETLFRTGAFLERYPNADPRRVAIVTNAGGAGVLAADAAIRSGLVLPSFSSSTRATLRRILPLELPPNNPLDLRGDAPPSRYGSALRTLARDRSIDALLVLCTPQVVTHAAAVAKHILPVATKTPTVAVFLGGASVGEARAAFARARVPAPAYPDHAAIALAAAARSAELRRAVPTALPRLPRPKRPLKGLVLLGPDAERPLAGAGVPVLRSITVPVGSSHLPRVAFPAVAKLIHPRLLHKTDVGAVVADLHSRKELARTIRELTKRSPDGRGTIAVQPQRSGFEAYVGGLWHPRTGPVLAFGSGGIGVERSSDTVFVMLPATRAYLASLLSTHPLAERFAGFRGQRGNGRAFLGLLARVATFLSRHPEILELDLNPVMVDARSAIAVDCRMVVKTL